jgi:hypothetical protein
MSADDIKANYDLACKTETVAYALVTDLNTPSKELKDWRKKYQAVDKAYKTWMGIDPNHDYGSCTCDIATSIKHDGYASEICGDHDATMDCCGYCETQNYMDI